MVPFVGIRKTFGFVIITVGLILAPWTNVNLSPKLKLETTIEPLFVTTEPLQVAGIIVAVTVTLVWEPTTTDEVAVHVFDKLLRVTVYIPDKDVVGDEVVLVNPPGPFHKNPGLVVVFTAVKVTLDIAQVMLPEVVAVTDGIDPSVATLIVAVAKHPVMVFVTDNV